MIAAILYSNGEKKDFQNDEPCVELELAVACYKDSYEDVEKILNNNRDIDLNASILHSKTKGNGTPLILTASEKIGKLLLEHGADINASYKAGDCHITALDSAYNEIKSNPNKDTVREYIAFLEANGAKRYIELK